MILRALRDNFPQPITVPLLAVMFLHVALSIAGINWGLPSRDVDTFLFPDGNPWSGEKIAQLSNAASRFSPSTGADVDVDPLDRSRTEAVLLNGDDAAIASIILRYRLYTYQPDEMITMMSLAGMRPGELQFDPRLYQYGGMFIYPVGALIKAAGMLGLIDVRSDLAFYLDQPEQFGRFYIVSRGYAAFWGLAGVYIVYQLAFRLLRGRREARSAAIIAALIFVLLPVVICMAHEGKPHLPGAVLMLAAVAFATGAGSDGEYRTASYVFLCICCGAAFGMVLSSLPVFLLIPVSAWWMLHSQHPADPSRRLAQRWIAYCAGGVALAGAVYLATNPYVLINAISNRAVLASNFGNSLAMYRIDRIAEGLLRVLQLTLEGVTIPVLIVGIIGMAMVLRNRNLTALPLLLLAATLFLQFVLIGAGKPDEFGRFGVFTDAALAILAGYAMAIFLKGRTPRAGMALLVVTMILIGLGGFSYVHGFIRDAAGHGSRMSLARELAAIDAKGVGFTAFAEPAPYCCPPMDFRNVRMELIKPTSWHEFRASMQTPQLVLAVKDHFTKEYTKETLGSQVNRITGDETSISWADKRFYLHLAEPP